VIFDVDGTLVDSNDAHARAWLHAFAEHGITVTYEPVRRAIGMGADKLMPLVAGIEEDSAQGKKISEDRKKIFKELWLPRLQPCAGARELVERLSRDEFVLAIASSASEEELHALLEAARVADLIPTRTSSDDADRSKPDPDIVTAAIKRAGCATEATVMIGDTPYDVEAATHAGIQIIALTCGGWRREDLTGAVAVYADPADLLMQYDFSRLRQGFGAASREAVADPGSRTTDPGHRIPDTGSRR
jgi:HAD superfamily hydrolase (TIGR01549 family)